MAKKITVRTVHPGTRWKNTTLGVDITGSQTATLEDSELLQMAIKGKIVEVVIPEVVEAPTSPEGEVKEPAKKEEKPNSTPAPEGEANKVKK